MTPSPNNPWQPGYACPFTLIGLQIGMTVHVRIVTGPVVTGTLIAISAQAICIDVATDRTYIPLTRTNGITWTTA